MDIETIEMWNSSSADKVAWLLKSGMCCYVVALFLLIPVTRSGRERYRYMRKTFFRVKL